jgi:hypothetical protein
VTDRRTGHRSESADRRESARIREDFAVRTTTDAGEVAIACAGELSENGLFVEYILPYERGTAVHVEFELPGGGAIQAEAEVASVETFLPADLSRKRGNGLRFTDLTSGARAAIRVFIDRSLG